MPAFSLISTKLPGTTRDGAMQPDWEELVAATAAKDKKRVTTPATMQRRFLIAQGRRNLRLYFTKREVLPRGELTSEYRRGENTSAERPASPRTSNAHPGLRKFLITFRMARRASLGIMLRTMEYAAAP